MGVNSFLKKFTEFYQNQFEIFDYLKTSLNNNQILMVLEQFAKLDNFKSKPIMNYNKLLIKNTMYVQLMTWIEFDIVYEIDEFDRI